MAVQYGVAHSSEVVGTAVFAGGPYYCAQGLVSNALFACMSSPSLISLPTLETKTRSFQSAGSIDNLSNLARQKIFLFSGTNDRTVYPGVVKKAEEMYRDLGVSSISTNYNSAAGHSFPTDNYGNACGTSQSPYITNCHYDGAGVALKTIYGSLAPRVSPIAANIKKMSIGAFTPNRVSPSSLSMDDTLYYYEPTGCHGNCTIHIAFSGCQMTFSEIQLKFVTDAGYNSWAEANQIVILYPFVIKSGSNPQGCWDWWGYLSNDAQYAVKSGSQIQTIHNIVQHFKQNL